MGYLHCIRNISTRWMVDVCMSATKRKAK
uniref:Uncharacterized protein n=1 Tax=Arundo donax TaxID=35708 RepID=A0A0A9FI84_ARUDO